MISSKYMIACMLLPLAACQTTPRHNADLKEAREAYATASLHPKITQAAANELADAKRALDKAEAAWADRHNDEETRHLAYLAHRRAQAAHLVALRVAQEEELKNSAVERERIRADANSQDAQAARQRAMQAGARADDLAQALERMKARQTDLGLVVTVQDVLFDTAKAGLKPGAQRTAEQLAQVLQQRPKLRVRVEGFADSRGSEEANLQLSQRRAEAFRDALVQHGVTADRIEVQGLGEGFPVASNQTASGRQQNRRVEVLFSDEAGQLKSRP